MVKTTTQIINFIIKYDDSYKQKQSNNLSTIQLNRKIIKNSHDLECGAHEKKEKSK